MKTLTEQLACARRELALRRNTYPKWVASGRMKPEAATHETECMEAIVNTLQHQVWLAEVSQEMAQPKPQPKPKTETKQSKPIDWFPDPVRQFALIIGHP